MNANMPLQLLGLLEKVVLYGDKFTEISKL
jgi:hypothetical protein